MTSHQKCSICNKDLGCALPVRYWGKDAHLRCVDNKLKEDVVEEEIR